ncbi:MAG: hypothetical protein QME79_08370 [Bacillota bacterium]|nr:hypothetical protein [Bacillota bacterium]
MEGFAYLVAPEGWRERQRWFPLVGWVPEPLLGQAGRFIPWRTLVEFPPAAAAGSPQVPPGAVVGLAATAEGFQRWELRKRQQHLIRLVEELATRGLRIFGLGRGWRGAPGAAEPVREAVRAVWGEAEAGVVEGWAAALARCLAGAEMVAAARRWDCEQVEVVVVGGETPAGQVAARLLARRFGRLTLAGDGPPLVRLAGHILHETGTAARISGRWGRLLYKADLVVLAAPLSAGTASLLRPEAVVLEVGAGAGERREGVVSDVLFSWPAGRPSAGLPGTVWPAGEGGGPSLVTAGLATVAAAGAGARPGGSGGVAETLCLLSRPQPSLTGVLAVRRALEQSGLRPAAVLDKAGTVLL